MNPFAAAPRIGWSTSVVAVAWAFLVLVTLGPVASVVGQAAGRLAAGEPEAWALLLPSARRLALLGSSLASSLCVAVVTTVVGCLAAPALLRWAAGRSSTAPGLFAVLALWAITPPYLHALAAMAAGNALRALSSGVGLAVSPPEIPGWLAAGGTQGFALLPFSLAAGLVGFLSVGRAEIEAAAMLAPRPRVFRRIVLPLAAPAVVVGAAAVFVFSLLDYSTPSLFGRPSYAMEIVAEYTASHAAWRAAILAFPLIGMAGVAIAGALSVVSRSGPPRERTETSSFALVGSIGPSPVAEGIASAITLGYAAVFTALTAAGLGLGSALVGLVWEVRRDLWITLGDAFLVGTAALGPAAAIGWYLAASRRPSTLRKLLWIGVLLPLALPPALVGIGIAEALANWAPSGLRTSALIPVLADLARFSPFAVLAVHARVARVDPLLIDAARLLRPPGPARWGRIEAPLAAPGLVVAFALVFCGSVGELEATLMSAAPGAGVLSMRVFNYLHYGASETVAALGLVLGAILWSVVVVAFRIGRSA